MPTFTHDETLRELPTDEGTLRYHEAGEGPPLLMLHGSGPGVSGWRNYGANLPAFAEHFRCLVLEFPGYGVSDDVGEHPMMAAGPAVLRFLDGMGLDRVHVMGNSLGGAIAAQLAISKPERFRRLVSVGGIGTNIFSPFPGEGIRLLTEFAEDPTREKLVRWLHSMVYDPAVVTDEMVEQRWELASDPEAIENMRRMYGAGMLEARMKYEAESGKPPWWSNLNQLKVPTLLTWGRDDRVSPMDMALLPMRQVPDIEVHIFPKCGHWAMLEAKEAFEATVLAFLRREDAA